MAVDAARGHSPWFVPLGASAAEPETTLYCLPYAGGGASVYREWPGLFPDTIALVAVQPPGRERRIAEPPLRRVDVMADRLAAAIRSRGEHAFAFFGHSMGALVAFELSRRLAASDGPEPGHLFVSGFPAPRDPLTRPRTFELSDAEFLAELGRLDGTPSEILAHPELMELMLPRLRADFELVETYRYDDGPPLRARIVTLAGRDDSEVPPTSQAGWKEETTRPLRQETFPGGHFFLIQHPGGVARLVLEELRNSSNDRNAPSRIGSEA